MKKTGFQNKIKNLNSAAVYDYWRSKKRRRISIDECKMGEKSKKGKINNKIP